MTRQTAFVPVFIVLLSYSVLCGYSNNTLEKAEQIQTTNKKENIIKEKLDLQLTIFNVKKYIYENNFKCPVIVIKQCLWESGHLTSYRAVNDNNIIGLRKAKGRKTYATGERNQHATFNSWQECLKDYYLLQLQFKGNTEQEYYLWLKPYAEDSTYIPKIKNVRI